MKNFINEQERWKALEVGDTIYEEVVRCGDIDYHEMKIENINVKERYVSAHDVKGDYMTTLEDFLTEQEFNKRFIIKN